jgi:hypothetical protein
VAAGFAGVERDRGVGVGLAPTGVGEVFGVAPAAGVGDAWTFALGGVCFGVGVGLTAVFAFTGTGHR